MIGKAEFGDNWKRVWRMGERYGISERVEWYPLGAGVVDPGIFPVDSSIMSRKSSNKRLSQLTNVI